MKKNYLVLIAFIFTVSFSILQAQTIHYVKENGAGTKDGTSWVNASDDIQAMINTSAANDQVWVATGSYRPNRRADNISTISSSTDRLVSFLLKKDVKLYGGFVGTETTLVERSLTLSANKTILNGGDINGLGRIFNVIISSGDVGSARLDGFTIFGGTLGNPYSTNQVNGNEISSMDGSGMYNHTSSPTIANCIFYGNFSINGGGMYNYNSSPTIINSTFYGDIADSDGDEIYNESSSPKIYNSIVWGTIFNNSSTPEIKNSIIKGSNNTTDGNIDATTLTDATLFKDPANGDYSLKAGGIAVNTGSNTLYTNTGGNLTTDVDALGNKRVFQNTIDIGAYESQKAIITPDTNNILYVNKAVIGEGIGNSWANAIPELADALVWAQNNKADFTTTPLQIWVAGGTYKPLYSPEDGTNFGTDQSRNNAFLMVNNVQLYGGFAGTETILTDRDLSLVANKTTLNGDFNNDDTITGSGSTLSIGNNTENAYHVIVSSGDVKAALLDGFSITSGNAKDNSNSSITINSNVIANTFGGGIYNHTSSPRIANITFTGNSGNFGGAIVNNNSSPIINNSSFNKNKGVTRGGAITNFSSAFPKIYNSSFIGNLANEAGAISLDPGDSADIINCTIVGNKATTNGDGIQTYQATLNIYNSIIWNVIYDINSSQNAYTVKNSIIKDYTDTTNGNIDATNLTLLKIFNDAANGDYSLNPSILNTAINAGDNALYTGTIATDKDVAGNARLFDGVATTDVIDLGAYELQQEPIPLAPTVSKSLQIYAGVKTVSDLEITGTNIKWYDAQTAGNFLENTTVLADNTTYYASQTVNGVESTSRIAVTAKKISEATQTFLSSANPTVANLVATPTTNATVKWFATATSSTALENTEVLTNSTYYIEQTSPLLTIKTLGSNFSQPFGITLQSDGKILVADTNNNVIKRMDADGTNIQILGSGFNKPRGVALQSDGKILVADAGNNAIKRMDADGSNIVTLNSTFNQPHGLAVQSDGKILVADSYNSLIKRMNADGSNIVTLGSGFSYPYGIAVQSDGKILVADAENNAIKRMDTDGSNIQILGTGFSAPSGVALQSDGKILVVGSGSNPVSRMDADGTNIVTLGSGFSISRGVAVQSDGKILLVDTNNNAIKRIAEAVTSNRVAVEVVIVTSAPTTSVATQVFAGDSKTLATLEVTGTAIKWYDAATAGAFLENTTVLADNTIYYASQTVNGVESTERTAVTTKKISEANQTFLSSTNPTVANLVSTPSTGATVKWFTTATNGTALENTAIVATGTYYIEQTSPLLTIETLGSGFSLPYEVAVQSDGKILIADTANNAIKRMNAYGSNIETIGSGFNAPNGVAVQVDGKILIADRDNNAIKRMDADGSNIEVLGSGFYTPRGVAVQSDGKILVSGTGKNVIKRMNADGSSIETLGSGFRFPYGGVAVQSDGKILVADAGNNVIKRMDADGTNIEILGSGFYFPSSVAVQSDGKILVADAGNSAIKRMDADGSNIEVLGSGFNAPRGVVMQSDGGILVADTNNNGIKRITEATISNRVAVEVVVKAIPTITFANFSKTYGDAAFDLAATSTSSATVTYSVVAGGIGEVTLSGKNITIVKPGTVTLKASVAENATFEAASKEITLTIDQKAITITADAKTKVYGEANPTLTYEITTGSLVGSDVFTGSLSRASGENVGDYAISSSLANTNYAITFVSADFTITEKATTITADAKAKVYGESDPALTYTISTGSLVGSDVLTGNLSRATGENVGDYAISSTLANANYNITFESANFTITKKAITITADAKSKVYGATDPTLTYSVSPSLVGSDVFTGSLSRASGENVGDYAISSSLANTNYAITFVSADFTITEKAITITADAKAKVYGESDPALTYTISTGSLESGDSLTGSLSRVSGEDVDTYAITQGSLSAGTNYDITFVSKDFTITKAMQTITFNALAHSDKDVFDLTATSSSGLAITYTSSDTNVATILGNTITVLYAGVTTITAMQAGNNNYEAASDVAQTLTIVTLGIDDEILSKVVKLYPNPAVNFIKLDIGAIEKASIKVFDINGKLVLDNKNYNSKEVLNISNLKIGIYFVKIKSNKGNTMKKFIKKE